MRDSKTYGMFGAGSAVLRKVIATPLARARNKAKAGAAEAGDPINTLIEGDIIPRLLMAHSSGGPTAAARTAKTLDPTDVNRFAVLPLQLEAAALMEEVDAFIRDGASVETICLELLAPSARRLGEMWEADECDFIDVTMGLWRLQEVMRDIAVRFPPTDARRTRMVRTALFAPMPGDVHNFGSLMVEEVFARAGWHSEALVKPERRELLDRLSRKPFDVVGLTLARDCPRAALSNLIKTMRHVSANPYISVLVGGRMINANPALALEVGADGTGADARAALELAETLVRIAPLRARSVR